MRLMGELVNAQIQQREPPHQLPQLVVVVTFRDGTTGSRRIEFDLTEGAVEILQWVVDIVEDKDMIQRQKELQRDDD